MYTIQIPLDAKLFLLCLCPVNYDIRKRQQIFLGLAVILSKRIIALSWKKSWYTKLGLGVRVRVTLTTLPLGKITYTLRGKESLFNNIWGPFVKYLKEMDIAYLVAEPEDE